MGVPEAGLLLTGAALSLDVQDGPQHPVCRIQGLEVGLKPSLIDGLSTEIDVR
jgi:hypothetical protein